jgi:glycolate oxidase FAD binding subunit
MPVVPWGGGTRMSVGAPPARLGVVLVLKRLNRILEHEPGDLTATAEAGITLGALQAELGKRGQWLSLDPAQADRATLGGVLSSNDAGPRRHLYGSCRDLLIGLTVITASGATVKGGGKVVKNVAGYDLPKLFIGAFGTLGVIVEATVKLRPRPDADRRARSCPPTSCLLLSIWSTPRHARAWASPARRRSSSASTAFRSRSSGSARR